MAPPYFSARLPMRALGGAGGHAFLFIGVADKPALPFFDRGTWQHEVELGP